MAKKPIPQIEDNRPKTTRISNDKIDIPERKIS